MKFPLLFSLLFSLTAFASPVDSGPVFYNIEIGDTFFHPIFTTRIQTVTASATSNVSSLAVTISPTQANSLIVVMASTNGTVVPTVTDSASQSYTSVSSFNTGTTTATFYKAASAAGVTSVTMSFTGATRQANIIVAEYYGVAISSPLDQSTSQNQAAVTSFTSGNTAATTQANELLIGTHFAHAHPAGVWGAGTGWAAVNNVNNAGQSMNAFMQEDYAEATGAQAATGTIGASDDIFSSIATFKMLANAMPRGFTIAGASTTVVSGSGTLKRVNINTAGPGGSTLKIYDGPPATGVLIANISTATAPATYVYNAAFSTSLNFVMSSSVPDVTLTYQTAQ